MLPVAQDGCQPQVQGLAVALSACAPPAQGTCRGMDGHRHVAPAALPAAPAGLAEPGASAKRHTPRAQARGVYWTPAERGQHF